MRFRAWLVQPGTTPAIEAAVVGGLALEVIRSEFGREGSTFALSLAPAPDVVEVEVTFTASLTLREVAARLPLIVPDVDLAFGGVEELED